METIKFVKYRYPFTRIEELDKDDRYTILKVWMGSEVAGTLRIRNEKVVEFYSLVEKEL